MAKAKKPGRPGGPPSFTPVSGTRVTFFGFAAYVGSLRGPTHCEWWPDDPNALAWAKERLIETDLSKTPSAARNGLCSVAEIQCDDHKTDGGLTMIGPRFPQGTTVGAIWLSEAYWNSLGDKKPAHPSTPDARPYELALHMYLDGPLAGRRYHGVHAKIVGTQGPLTRVELYHPGRSRVDREQPFGAFWLDLAQDAHPIGPGATEIGAGKVEGALFLEAGAARQVQLRGPKQPYWMGAEHL